MKQCKATIMLELIKYCAIKHGAKHITYIILFSFHYILKE